MFLVNYSCSLKCIEIILVKYSYFGSCPISRTFGVHIYMRTAHRVFQSLSITQPWYLHRFHRMTPDQKILENAMSQRLMFI